jgi:hypothetical protein
MKMIGMRLLCAISRSRRSIPLIPGICTSVIRQELSSTRGERRKSSAESNAKATKPCDLRRLCIAARTDASSSTIETIGDFDTRAILLWALRPGSEWSEGQHNPPLSRTMKSYSRAKRSYRRLRRGSRRPGIRVALDAPTLSANDCTPECASMDRDCDFGARVLPATVARPYRFGKKQGYDNIPFRMGSAGSVAREVRGQPARPAEPIHDGMAKRGAWPFRSPARRGPYPTGRSVR